MYAYICHMCVDVHGGLKRLWDSLELKLGGYELPNVSAKN